MKRKVTAILAALAVLVGVSACGNDEANEAANVNILNKVYEVSPTLQDGRKVTCLIYNGLEKGGLSCDWEGAE